MISGKMLVPMRRNSGVVRKIPAQIHAARLFAACRIATKLIAAKASAAASGRIMPVAMVSPFSRNRTISGRIRVWRSSQCVLPISGGCAIHWRAASKYR
jgi:hypothetical protein